MTSPFDAGVASAPATVRVPAGCRTCGNRIYVQSDRPDGLTEFRCPCHAVAGVGRTATAQHAATEMEGDSHR